MKLPLSFNISKTRIFSVVLFMIALAIVSFSAVNYFGNIHPYYWHIQDASLTLDKANEALTTGEKTACIEKAIQLYGDGPNLATLQSLTSQSTTEEFQSVADALTREFNGYAFNPCIRPAIFEVFLLCSAFYLATGLYKGWSEAEKTVGFTFVTTLEIVSFALFVI